MVAEWTGEIREAARHALDDVAALPSAPRDLEAVVGRGETWDEALEEVDWREGDVLVVGSSSAGPVSRVFLGSRSNKIVRHSPVPVVVVPRPAAAELAEEAMEAPEERPRELR
jgi:nucleotide-binding universal stress UspA family protein